MNSFYLACTYGIMALHKLGQGLYNDGAMILTGQAPMLYAGPPISNQTLSYLALEQVCPAA